MTPAMQPPTVSATTPATARKRSPIHGLSILAFAAGIIASAFALYGSFLSESHLAGSPLTVLRKGEGLEVTREPGPARFWIPFAAYFLPLGLGIAAALLGAEALKAIERSGGACGGSGPAVFAIMIGGLSAVISGCMIFAVYGWKHVPTVYTY